MNVSKKRIKEDPCFISAFKWEISCSSNQSGGSYRVISSSLQSSLGAL
jgi:hypothetical protein